MLTWGFCPPQVVKANATHHLSESILINTDDMAASPTNDELSLQPIVEGQLAPFYCDASLVTTAGQVGSMYKQRGCEIKFDTRRRRRASAPTKPPPAGKAKKICDCSFAHKLGSPCEC